MGETRDRGIPATPDGIAKLKNAKNTGKDDNGKPWTFPSIAEKADIQSHKTVGRFFKGEGIDKGNAYAICQALNLDINEIVDRHEWNPPSPPATQIDWRETCRAAAQAKRQAANSFFANDLGRKIDLNEIHVPLGLIERQQKPQRRDDFSPQTGSQAYQEAEKLIPLSYDEFCEKVLTNSDSPKSKGKRLAVIGEPGAGKTTQLLKIGDRILAETEYLPVWISLAEVKKPLCQYLIEDWLRIAAGKLDAAPAEWVKEFNELLSEGKIWLLLDGADEMGIADSLGTLSPQLREPVFNKVRIVISCRLNIWEATGNALSDFDTYKMLDFSYGDGDNCDQVKLFIDQWFRSPPAIKKDGLANLRAALDEPGKERIKDLARNPLRLFLLCLTWEFGQQKLPDTKAELYEVFVAALYDFKKQAFPTTAAQRTNLNAALGKFALKAIEAGYKSILPDLFVSQHLAKPHPELFEKAIDLGWLNRVGVDAQNPLKSVYAFYHPSFQEYFAACEIEDWHFFLNHVPQNPQQGIYRIFERQWKEVMLLWMGRKDVVEREKEALIDGLVKFNDGFKGEFYWYRAYFLAAAAITEFKNSKFADEIVQQIIKWSFGCFYKNLKDSQFHSSIIEEARAALPKADYHKAVKFLLPLLDRSKYPHIRHEAIKTLGVIGTGNCDAIQALNSIIDDPSENICCVEIASCSLGKITTGNLRLKAIKKIIDLMNIDLHETAVRSLSQLVFESLDITCESRDLIIENMAKHIEKIDIQLSYFPTNWLIAKAFLKIAPTHHPQYQYATDIEKRSDARIKQIQDSGIDMLLNDINILGLGDITAQNLETQIIEIISNLNLILHTNQDDEMQEIACNCLESILLGQKFSNQAIFLAVIQGLKDCSDHRIRENYKVIWHCAQNLPYPTFSDAWHHPHTTPHPEVPDTTAVGFTSTTSTLNWQTFPQDIAREINNQAELSNQIQLLCIDCKKIINPDNPAAKIYTEMLKQGCPKCEDATKTMADLQTYWDLLLMDSEKSLILVFYNSRGEEATGFSEIFVNDLSKFDGNIAIVSDNNADLVKAFSPSQSDLIGAIVRWICQVVWES